MKIYQKFIFKILLALAFLSYATILYINVSAQAGGSDSSGYLNAARLIISGKLHEDQRIVENISYPEISQQAYMPLGFSTSSPKEMVPTYPLGLPLLIVFVSFFFDLLKAPNIVMWLHSLGSIILIYRIARELKINRIWSVFSSILLAANPLFVSYSSQLMSDVPALFWNSLTIFAALKSRKESRFAIVAGLAAGLAVMIRPTNIFIFAPALVVLGYNKKSLFYFIGGGAPMAMLLSILNYHLYGKIFTTGYSKIDSLLSWEYLAPSIKSYVFTLPLILTPAIILCFGIFWPKLWKKNSLTLPLLFSWLAPFFIFYSFYYFTHTTWWYTRFLLPAFPALILLICEVMQELCKKISAEKRASIFSYLTAFVLFWHWCANLNLDSFNSGAAEKEYTKSAAWVNKNLEKNAILLSYQTSGSLLFYTDFSIVRWDVLTPEDLKKIKTAAQKSNRPIYAILFSFEEKDALKISEKWRKITDVNNVKIWELLPAN